MFMSLGSNLALVMKERWGISPPPNLIISQLRITFVTE